MGLYKTNKVLYGKGNYQKNEKTTYWMGGDICEQYIWQGVKIQNIPRTHTTQHQKLNNPI